MFGNKAGAKEIAKACNVPLVPGTEGATDLDAALAFQAQHPDLNLMVKAVHGGGGRGMRIVEAGQDLAKTFERCASEAQMAFGSDALYVEALLDRVRHVEVQILGDGQGSVTHLWERECSVQRQNQKLLEVAPCPNLLPATRDKLLTAAKEMAASEQYRGLGTFEFLVSIDSPETFYFIEANARLQVEHTVTEAITGLDLVALQLRIAEGASLADLNLTEAPEPEGFAIQARINMEVLSPKGFFKPSGGTIEHYSPPQGPGIRVDGMGYAGYTTSTRYDSLLAKLIVHSRSADFGSAIQKLKRSLDQFDIQGFDTNQSFLSYILDEPLFEEGALHTRFVDSGLKDIAQALGERKAAETPAPSADSTVAGARIDADDPLAVLSHSQRSTAAQVTAPHR